MRIWTQQNLLIVFVSILILTVVACGIIDDLEGDKDRKRENVTSITVDQPIPSDWDGQTDWSGSLWLFEDLAP